MQIGIEATDGTVHPFNFPGGKPVSWSFKCAVGDPLELTTTWDFGQGFESTSALGSPTYPDAQPFIFVDGAASIGGSAVSITEFTLNYDNALKTDRRFIGNTKAEQLANSRIVLTGDFGFEFDDLTRQGDLADGTLLTDIALTFTQGANTLVINIAEFMYDGEAPEAGPDLTMEKLSWEAYDDGTNPLIEMVYTTTDAAP